MYCKIFFDAIMTDSFVVSLSPLTSNPFMKLDQQSAKIPQKNY